MIYSKWGEIETVDHIRKKKYTQRFENNLDKIGWWYLSSNPSAIELLEANPDKIHWDNIWKNPSIFYKGKPTKGARH